MEKEKEKEKSQKKIMTHLLLFEQYILEEKKPKGGLDKWFGEKWVDISKTNADGSHPPCGRSDASKGSYPKCRKVRVAARMTDKQKKASVQRKRKVEREGSKGTGRKPNYAK